MRPSTVLVSTLAVVAHAAPAFPELNIKNLANPVNALDSLSTYLSLVAIKVQNGKATKKAPQCDLSRAQMPLNGLPSPDAGLTVRHVAVGRGTQNYTCDANNANAVPKAAGAVATLFNVSCIASMYPDLVERMPDMAVNFDLETTKTLGPTVVPVSGVHFFTDATTPFFNLDTPSMDIGEAPCAKNSSVQAPSTAAVGQIGDTAVPWLKLTTKNGATGNIKEVYRVNTAGGNPPTTCKGQPAAFQVQYSAV
ncbi:hypothetical protein PT974_04281 [Cladobotryum mycophilum]|uniref:Malate dehydrogenase n=1 Tax=Cladobotryum mycophilum TaxID=491253 RepID=A0ABR0SUM0_9HYPO